MQSVSPTFSGSMNGSYRNMLHGVLVSWDKQTSSGINYFTIGNSRIGGTDILKTTGGGTIAAANLYKYTTIPQSGIVNWSTSMSLDQYPYGLVQRQADVTLSNASKALLPASGTALGPYIESGRPVIIQTGFNSETIPMFTGYSDSPVNDITARTISLHCYDAIDYLNSYNSKATVPQINQRKDQIIATLLAEAGFATSQYVLERSLDSVIAYFDPFGLMIGDIIRDFCEAEGAIFFADEAGIMHYWNRQHFSNNSTPVATLTYSNITSLKQQNSPIINYVSASSSPLVLASGVQQIFTLNQPYYMPAAYSTANNRVTNPSFEVSTSGWSGNIQRITSDKYVGTASASGTNAVYDLTSTLSVSPDSIGSQAAAQMWVKPTSGTSTIVNLNGSAVAGSSILGTQSGVITGNGQWQNVSLGAYHYNTNPTGALAGWTRVASSYSNGPVKAPQPFIINGYLYTMAFFPPNITKYSQLTPTITATNITNAPPGSARYAAVANSTSGVWFTGGSISGDSTPTASTYYTTPLSTGGLNTWSGGGALPAPRTYHAASYYNGYVYVYGGADSGFSPLKSVYYASVNSDQTLGAWTSTTNMPTAKTIFAGTTYNGYIYAAGGFTTTYTTEVAYAAINSDGTLGAWRTTSALPVATAYGSLVPKNGFMYYLGGETGSDSGKVYRATINANGTLGTWSADLSTITARSDGFGFAYGNYLYVMGGSVGGSATSEYEYTGFAGTGVTLSVSGTTKPFFLDAVTTDTFDAYFDGDTTSNAAYSYSWDGTTGLSSSTRTGVPYYLNVAASLNYETYSLVQPVASGLNNAGITAGQSYYSFSSVSGTGGIYGTDLTNNMSLVNYSVSGTKAFLTFRNNSSQQAYLTNLVLYGQTAQNSTQFSQYYLDQNSISQYRLNPTNAGQIMTISNNYIPTPGDALGLSEYLVQGYSTPYLKHTTDIFTKPNLQFGDCVSLVNSDTGETRTGYIMGIQNTGDSGGISQALIIQEKNIANYFTIGVSNIGGVGKIAP